jgi:hypothetical protein
MVLEEKTMKFSRFAETIQPKSNKHVVGVTVTLKISDCTGINLFHRPAASGRRSIDRLYRPHEQNANEDAGKRAASSAPAL